MLLLTDRLREAQQLQHTLQRVQPCEVAALHQAASNGATHALIVCDVALDLPRSIELLRAALAQHRLSPTTPVLVLLRDPSHVTKGQAKLAGATATLTHPWNSADLLATAAALITDAQTNTAPSSRNPEVRAGVKEAGKILGKLFQSGVNRTPISAESLREGSRILLDVIKQADIRSWLDIVWTYDDATYQHCLLVAGLTAAFALELALPPTVQHALSQAALIHDIGKAQIPRHILNKAGKLTAAETAIMQSHADVGWRMLAGQPGLDKRLLDVVRHHHEYLDGSGYPDRLQAAQIPRMVRLVTICDIYAALVERRVYKAPLAPALALDHLDEMGAKLDQPLVKAFRSVVRQT